MNYSVTAKKNLWNFFDHNHVSKMNKKCVIFTIINYVTTLIIISFHVRKRRLHFVI